MAETKLSSGVQELIDRLHQDGVDKGREEADRLIAEAREEAKTILLNARHEVERMRHKAQEEADHFANAGRDAVKLAARDTVLHLKSALTRQFARRIGEMVAETLRDETFLQRLILEVAGRALPTEAEEQAQEILLPRDVIGLEELRRHPEKVKEGGLGNFVMTAAAELLRDGVVIRERDDRQPGIRIRLVEDDVTIDLTGEALTQLLLAHLLPRFRAILEGSIQ